MQHAIDIDVVFVGQCVDGAAFGARNCQFTRAFDLANSPQQRETLKVVQDGESRSYYSLIVLRAAGLNIIANGL